MENFLDRMAHSSRERARTARAREGIDALTRRAADSPPPVPLSLDTFDLIAELKLRSPAAGGLADPEFDPNRQLDAYVAGGATAVSVLTEPAEFKGELEHLASAAARLRAHGCPVMRKDFLVDPYQVIEARANGASGILVIVAMLGDAELDEMIAAAREQRLFVLLEAFDTDDLERLSRLTFETTTPTMIGVNSRNLRTLAVDFERFTALAGQIRGDVPAVAESGIDGTTDIQTVAAAGYSLALVGSALMRQDDVANTVRDFIEAGRKARAGMK